MYIYIPLIYRNPKSTRKVAYQCSDKKRLRVSGISILVPRAAAFFLQTIGYISKVIVAMRKVVLWITLENVGSL